MQGLLHPLSGDRYELEADGTVRVHQGERTGTFDATGRWLSGTVTWADPALCVWLAGGTARPSRAAAPTPDPPSPTATATATATEGADR